MLKSYLITTIRLLMKQKLFTAINVGGLTIGLTAAFIIILFTKNEMGYDRWLADHQRIFTIETVSTPPDRAPRKLARTARELRGAMEKDFADIESFTRFYAGSAPVKIDNILFVEKSFRIEETFFDVFKMTFQQGRREAALSNASSAVVSADFANKHFPGNSVLGEIIEVRDQPYTITGVLEQNDHKTHLDFDILLYESAGALNGDFIDWTSARLYSYFLLSESGIIENIREGTANFLNRNAFFAPESWQDYTPSEVMGLSYLPIADIHLFQNARNQISAGGSVTLVYGFIGIAALIIVMAAINFISFSTASSSTREKEIATHKVVGASRNQLTARYLTEALILTMLAFLLAQGLTEILAPLVFNWINLTDFSETALGIDFIAMAALISVITGLIAGIYPALHLASKSPANAFSGGHSKSPRVAKFRIVLVFLQYSISVILVICAVHFYLQTRLATSMDLGFKQENVIAYWGIGGAENSATQQALLDRVRQVPGVSSATRMAQLPGKGSQNNVNLKPIDTGGASSGTRIQAVAADADFERVLGMGLIAGRSFNKQRENDRMMGDNAGISPVIINELALSALGLNDPEQTIGQTFQMQDYLNEPVNVEIIGVMKNAHFQSIHSDMVPMLFANAHVFFDALAIKLEQNPGNALAEIDKIWLSYIPDVAVYKKYLLDDLAAQYALEDQQIQVFSVFAALAVVIAFLGIFGLAAFNVERKTREVGIRKVFGASVLDIVWLFVWQFSKPVMWAVLFSWPVAGLVIDRWLQSYAYRIDLMPLVFISAGVSVLFIAWLTIASHAAKAARKSPILALRHE